MENTFPGAELHRQRSAILRALEEQLPLLDNIGADVAAAHVDTAIQLLRQDIARGPV